MPTATEIQQRAMVIDGLSYYSDGHTGDLRNGGINALNVTVANFEAEYAETWDRIAGWLDVVRQPVAEWRMIETLADLEAAPEGEAAAV